MYKHQKILDYVNEFRAKYDIGPPLTELRKGTTQASFTCPIAKSIQDKPARLSVYQNIVVYPNNIRTDGYVLETVPRWVFDWLKEFDHGYYPELIA